MLYCYDPHFTKGANQIKPVRWFLVKFNSDWFTFRTLCTFATFFLPKLGHPQILVLNTNLGICLEWLVSSITVWNILLVVASSTYRGWPWPRYVTTEQCQGEGRGSRGVGESPWQNTSAEDPPPVTRISAPWLGRRCHPSQGSWTQRAQTGSGQTAPPGYWSC